MTEKRARVDEPLRLGDLARAAGVSTQTVEYYLMVGLIDEEDRTPGGRRLFSEKTVRRVKLIGQLNKSGYTLRDIREIFRRRLAAE